MKTCIFCGERPESKNKEHVIPQWLIKMTGDPNRQINLGADMRRFSKTGEKKLMIYSFSAFTFPACEICNNEFSKLENQAKESIEKIFAKDYLSTSEINILLDWFDKVRIGLWLGGLKLEDTEEDISPAFYIKQRMGNRDRALFVYEMEETVKNGINMVGTSTPGFQYMPSCFALRINNLYFYNISFDFLLAYRIGFPYPDHFAVSSEDERLYSLTYTVGTGKLKLPLLDFNLLQPGISIYQPIIASETTEEDYQTFFMNDYVQKRLLYKSRGAIFFEEMGELVMLGEDDEIRLEGYQKLPYDKTRKNMNNQVMATIEKLLSKKQDLRNLNAQQKKIFNTNMKTILKAHRDLMYKGTKTLLKRNISSNEI